MIFPVDLAVRIGIDLATATPTQATSIGTVQPVRYRFAPVILLLTDGQQTCRWRAVVGCTQAFLRFPILGIAGGLEHFRTTLDVVQREIILPPQPTLPVTTDAVP